MKYSEDASASNGGDLGVLEKGKMVKSFEDAAFELQAGEVSSIIKTPYGLHIIKVEKIIQGRDIPFQEAKKKIRDLLYAQEAEKQFRLLIAELRKTAFIETSLFEDSRDNISPEDPIEAAASEISSFPQEASLDEEESLTKKTNGGKKHSPVVLSQKKRINKGNHSESMALMAMEKKLTRIKELMERKVISESEYQKRKEQLLNQL
ncbi:MAG: peptidylprolyl isomerase [Nitrospinales bacterium]